MMRPPLSRFRLRTLMIAVAVVAGILATITWAINGDDGDGDIPVEISVALVLFLWACALTSCLVLKTFLVDPPRGRPERRRLDRIAPGRPPCDSHESRRGG
jgi:hypothetical protein